MQKYNLPDINEPESIEALVSDFVRLKYIGGGSINNNINFILSQNGIFYLSIGKRLTSEHNYEVQLLQLTVSNNQNIHDYMGTFVVSPDFTVIEYKTLSVYEGEYLQIDSILLVENLEKHFYKTGRLLV